MQEVTEAESILKHLLHMILGYSDYYVPISDSCVRKYHRQYLGYFNQNGNHVVRILMYDFTKVKESDEYYLEFSKKILVSLESDTEYLYRSFLINLDTREIEKGSSQLLDEFWFLGEYRGGEIED